MLVVDDIVVFVLEVVLVLAIQLIGMPIDEAVAVPVPALLKVTIVEAFCPGVLFNDILNIGKLHTVNKNVVLTLRAYFEVAYGIPIVCIGVGFVLASDNEDG